MAKPNNHIPQDITDQILPYLPVKSLIRFKCASKSWRSLISSPPFTRNHFERASSQDPKIIAQKILIVSLPCGLKSLDLEKSLFDDEDAMISLRFPPIEPCNRVKILGSCNGLVCLNLDNDASTYTGSGFGYDSSSNDYKLVLEIDRRLVIFSLAKSSWSMRQDRWWPRSAIGKGVYSNGALHWHIFNGIISFDLKTYIFGYVRKPDAKLFRHKWRLFEAEKIFCGSCMDKFKNSLDFELWMMKKDGVEGYWTKVLTFQHFYDFYCFFINFLNKNYSDGKDDFVTENSKDIIRCEGEGGIVKKIRIHSCPKQYESKSPKNSPYFCDAIAYEETLVWPNDLSNNFS
ncbi:F-box/kelch-repeat protein At3g23880-like [Durio zibethinus]|uniref:F-box/kelch-repeat protein At3g23880-like n=1 Tax=Durio zibethinus TaxID=66656 RepID=A0A6P6A7L3_DURZI|nr:F-box/kelch-repeat protein At3g23880-like [Durio zibethinus]